VDPDASPPRLHRAARAEDVVQAGLGRWLRRRGWRPQVLPYTGYGGPGWVRVLARVLLTRPPGVEHSGDQQLVRGWRSFVTAPVAGAEVMVEIGGRRHVVRTDRSGYVDVVLESGLEAGWREVALTLDGETATSARVLVVAADQELGIVSDIDDTVMVTWLPRPLIAAWNTFVLHEQARRAVPGMAGLYREILGAEAGTAPVFYLSTGAWNVAPTLRRFLSRHHFPDGPLLLTDWGPTNTGWFRSGREHKRAALRRLRRELPHLGWVLVGDDGQHDPDLYAEFAREAPQHVRAIAIRELSAGQQVLSHGLPVPGPDGQPQPRPAVPVVRGPDGTALARRLRHIGVPGWAE
jgi:phosphatidate phosphatase APP1